MSLPSSDLHSYAKETLIKRKRQYIESPELIIENYNSEYENINSYNGRQLLEMLQNADDAASKVGCSKKAFIKLDENILVIANTGESFSQGGLESILYSNLSPKVMVLNMIGQKGLGFRSVLSWAEEVTISSAGINLRFSRELAANFLKEIIAEAPAVQEVIKKKSKFEHPIAILRVPEISEHQSELTLLYDTVITIKLKDEIIEEVQEQINNIIDPETLIFLNNLLEIEITSPERVETLYKIEATDSVTIRSSTNQYSKVWHVKTEKGIHEEKNYELKVAWNKELTTSSNVIYSFFKTNQPFPFPGLAHGTFELTPDRNHLVNDPLKHNEFLLARLADLMVETAVWIANTEGKATYRPLTILDVKEESLTGVFLEYQFSSRLLEKIRTAEILPNVNEEYIGHGNEPVFLHICSSILTGDDVSDLLLFTDDSNLHSLLTKIGLFNYPVGEFSAIIHNRLRESAKDLAPLIKTFISICANELKALNGNYQNLHLIFRDISLNPISWDKKLFLPEEGDIVDSGLPDSLELAFLDPTLTIALQAEFDDVNYTGLLRRLEPFTFRKFSFDVFAELLEEIYLSKWTKENVSLFHYYLFLIRKKTLDSGEIASSRLNYQMLPVIAQDGTIVNLKDIYLGLNYGEEIPELLFAKNRRRLLGAPEVFNLLPCAEVTDYFHWLRVKRLPNKIEITMDSTFRDFSIFKGIFLDEHDFKTRMGNYVFSNKSQMADHLTSFRVCSYDDLEEILMHAGWEAIFKWLKADSTLKNLLEEKYDKATAPLVGITKSSYTQYAKMPNYLKWKFKTTRWLPSKFGHVAPTNCTISKTIGEALEPLLTKLDIPLSKLSKILDLGIQYIESYLIAVGVHEDISSLTTDQLYEMLSELKNRRIDGKLAKFLYREILNNYDENTIDIENDNYKSFIKYGWIWSVNGTEAEYRRISSCKYLDSKKYGENIISEFNLAAFDRKQGNKKVLKIFGVEPLNNLDFRIKGKPTCHPLSQDFHKEIDMFKAYAYALGREKDSKYTILNQFKKLQVIVVSNLQGEYMHGNEIKNFRLNDYDFISESKNRMLNFYIQVPIQETDLNTLRTNLNFSEAIAEVFTTVLKSEVHRSFIRELYCRRPQDRDELFIHELQTDGYQRLQKSRELLKLSTDQRANFWRAYFHAKNIAVAEKHLISDDLLKVKLQENVRLTNNALAYFLDRGNYDILTKPHFLRVAFKLFCSHKVDFPMFAERFEDLDFTSIIASEFINFKAAFENSFAKVLYDEGRLLSWDHKSKFFETLNLFNSLSYDPNDGYQSNVLNYFLNQVLKICGIKLSPKPTEKEWSISKVLEQATINFNAIQPFNIDDYHLNVLEIQSLLIYDEFEKVRELLDIAQSRGKSTNVDSLTILGGSNLDISDMKMLNTFLNDSFNFEQLEIERIGQTFALEKNNSAVVSSSTGRSMRGFINPLSSANNEKIGFIAEKLVYEVLCREGGVSDVIWKSENSRKCGINNLGVAGLGYDLQYTQNGEVRFVEVKCITSPELGLIMTENEMRVALTYPTLYEIFTVEKINTVKPVIRKYVNLFDFDDSETIFQNKRFILSNDSYKLRFTTKVEETIK